MGVRSTLSVLSIINTLNRKYFQTEVSCDVCLDRKVGIFGNMEIFMV